MNEQRICQIKEWLNLTSYLRKRHCPFHAEPETGKICEKLFPKILDFKCLGSKVCGTIYKCPCYIYDCKYVSSKARKCI
jgi:hypothetical protein